MATVRFTRNIQRHVACPTREVAGGTLRDVLDEYFRTNEQARGYVLDEQGKIRQHMVVFIDGEQARDRDHLTDPVAANAMIDVIQALSGGLDGGSDAKKNGGRMRTFALVALFCVAAVVATGQTQNVNNDLGYTDTPILPGLPFHVHDPSRPHPRVVTPSTQLGGPPSDAVVLFEGEDLSAWESKKSWKVENGYFEVVPGAGSLTTKAKFGDVQLHVEWATPSEVRGNSQNRGNSGIFLQGLYEVQVLDSFANPTYADGQAGALYGQWPPLVNATRRPGEWQVYDIVFEAPQIDNGQVVKPAYMTVFLNGILLHNRKELMGPTVHRQLAKYGPQPKEGPLVLQDHGTPVRYRNIWARALGRYDQ